MFWRRKSCYAARRSFTVITITDGEMIYILKSSDKRLYSTEKAS